MTQIEAIYQNQVFRPLQAVDLKENQRVLLSIQSVEPGDPQAWLMGVQERQQRIARQRGFFPDSARDIAEDRRR